MSTIENGVSTVATNPHAEAVQERVKELQRWREQIPNFVIPRDRAETKRLSAAASVPPEFVELTTVAIANQAALVRTDGHSPASMRDLMTYADAYDPLADELEALAQFIRHSTTAARNEAGAEALTVYAMAQRLVKRPKYAGLAPYVADMRRALGRVRKPSPEEAAQKAAERAVKAAAKVAKKALKAPPPAEPEPAPKG